MTKWFLHQPPRGGDFVVFGLPYAGTGASSFTEWPRQLGSGWFCPVQPPGRENRSHEDVPASHQEFAEQFTDALTEVALGNEDRPFGLLGHCGAVPYLLQIAGQLEEQGLPLPHRLFASSWGPPDQGLYGRLNFVELETVDLVAEINALCTAMGRSIAPEMAEIAAETMRADLRVQRQYRYEDAPVTTAPVCVIGWTRDDVVPAEQVWPGWQRCALAHGHVLDGDHWELLRCPLALRELIIAEMAA
ncbi:MAG TPA: thioesterase domain-containing protein [Streptosporangiaceae bacterium]|nr:thioesterase domain-containing protein [Streptosporangiaceae bacterium]